MKLFAIASAITAALVLILTPSAQVDTGSTGRHGGAVIVHVYDPGGALTAAFDAQTAVVLTSGGITHVTIYQ